ncbi:MAG: SpoIIE family protein phosphatase [Bacteroidales bacterium]|nr:SpoIIE family protein phosphatase [Bacteroidales bacterium]
MNRIKNSFSKRLSLNILLITSVLIMLMLGIVSLFSYRIIENEAQQSARNLLHSTIYQIQSVFTAVEEDVKCASWLVDENREDPDYMYEVTRKLADIPGIVGSAVAFKPYHFEGKYYYSPYSFRNEETGNIEDKQLGNQKYDYFFMDWYQIPFLLGEPCWSEPYFDEGGGDYMMTTYSYPMKDDEGQIYAIITADVSLKRITELLESIKPYPNSYVNLVSRSGKFVSFGKDNALMGRTIFSTAIESGNKDIYAMARDMMDGNDGIVTVRREGKKYFRVYGSLSNKWSMFISCSYFDILFRAIRMQTILTIVGIFFLALLFLICYSVIRKMTQPLTEFSESAISIAGGNFNTALPEIKSEDEIGQLKDSFDHMQKSIREYIHNLKNTTQEKERLESELNIASKIQMAMLSKKFPNSENIELHAILRPAKQVGGDLYDFFIYDKHILYFTVGDVSGKGVPASLIMAITRAFFRFVANMDVEPDKIVSRLNYALSDENDSGMFVTLFVGRLDLSTGELSYCNAGHNPVVLNGKFLDVKPNLAVGLINDFKFELQRCLISKGDKLLLYTDGITEAERTDFTQFGEERLLAWVNSLPEDTDSSTACHDLYDEVKKFTDGNEQNDDITIMTIKYK